MILSFHPMHVGDENRIVAGRPANEADRAAIARADAVILPQGCREDLYRLVADQGKPMFPDYRARFHYPGKCGQAILFKETGVTTPDTFVYSDTRHFREKTRNGTTLPFPFPLVVKLDCGGEGETVFFANDDSVFQTLIDRISDFEESHQAGFLIQEFIPSGNRCLRVGVIGNQIDAYWRVQPDPAGFATALSRGGHIERQADPTLEDKARRAIRHFCDQTGIDLAGFDLLFDCRLADPPPLFLEINWFFGRSGYGGSDRFYTLLNAAIDDWIAELPSDDIASVSGVTP